MAEIVKEFLQRLLDYGFGKGYFEKKTIGKLDKSCCENSSTQVIDFDRTKEQLTARVGFKPLKSCDALKIIPGTGHLDFIELKGFKKFIQHRFPSGQEEENQVRRKVASFELIDKIKHSIYLLSTLVYLQEFDATKDERKIFDKIPKQFIIVIDIEMEEEPLELLAVNLAYLSETSTSIEKQIASILESELGSIPASNYDNIKKPRLMNCCSIDKYYAVIEGSKGHE